MSHNAEVLQLTKLTNSPSVHAGTLWKSVAILLLLAWLYIRLVGGLVFQWWHDPNFSHGFFVPAFSLYLLWLKRDRLRSLPIARSWLGLPILLAGLGLLVIGNLGAELFLARFSFLLVIAGLVICFLGWEHQRELLFPWLFLIVMIPIPAIVFNQITFPLQLLASRLASGILPLANVPVLRQGNIIQIPAMALEVAEACSGIRSLLSLVTLTIIYGYLMETKLAIRLVLGLASIPIAVLANSLRIVGTGLMVQYWNPEKAEGFFHLFSGWLIFVVSLLLVFGLHKLLRTFWRERVLFHAVQPI
ncbi:MAG TPA: exosortase A [Terriglobales bacterium]